MRLLWIGKASTDLDSGEEVFDRMMLRELRALGVEVQEFAPQRVSRLGEVGNLLRGVPYYRARYVSQRNRLALEALSARHAVAICSWEPFDQLALGLRCPVITILHNVTSEALPAVFPRNVLTAFLARLARGYETRVYGRRLQTIAVLARRDAVHIARRTHMSEPLYVPPGVPTVLPLEEDAVFARKIIISGSYGWGPKRRDLLVFAHEFVPLRDRFDVVAEDVPRQIHDLLAPRQPAPRELTRNITIGLVADRFTAGHKLKVGAYIASNAVVASFADIAADYADLPDADIFIRRIKHARELEGIATELERHRPDELRERFAAFKAACARRFSWEGSARTLLEAAMALAR